MAEPKLVDMARTKADLKEEKREMRASCEPSKYPWGLSLSLDTDELKKLGITDLPPVGTEMHLVAIARVTSVSSNANENQESNCVSLQLVKMVLQAPERPKGKGSSGLMGYYDGKG